MGRRGRKVDVALTARLEFRMTPEALAVLNGYVAAYFSTDAWANFKLWGYVFPVVFILVAENLGHIKAVTAMTGKNLDQYMGRAFIGDGIATMVSGGAGGTGVTTYAENIGVMAVE